ncbi:MAG: hypothetical protein E7578_04035 [Ruminococcaceae bacterium]|nr:hypothetical protein [Oscillospiraceae bacterium]
MNREDKDIFSNTDEIPAVNQDNAPAVKNDDASDFEDYYVVNNNSDEDDILSEEDDLFINSLFSTKLDSIVPEPTPTPTPTPAPVPTPVPAQQNKKSVKKPSKVKNKGAVSSARSDARYSMTEAEIDTLAAAAEDAVSDGRYGAALDSVFFTAGAARESLREKLNIRIPLGSADTDLPIIAAAALIDSYLEFEDVNGENIEEKLRLIIESSEDENRVRPSEKQVELRVFKCALILCVQAEQSGRHAEIKNRLFGGKNSFLCKYLERNIDKMVRSHRRELAVFSTSVKLQSKVVSEILDSYIASSKYSAPFPKRFLAESKPVLVSSIIVGVLCLISIIVYIVTYGNFMSFIATDNYLITLFIVLEALLCGGMIGLSWLIYTGGEYKEELKK